MIKPVNTAATCGKPPTPRLHVKGDLPNAFVSLLPENWIFRFVCIKHRRNLIADQAEAKDWPHFTQLVGTNDEDSFEKVTLNTPTEGETFLTARRWDIDLGYAYCPENGVDIDPSLDCADSYRVMVEVIGS